MWNLGLCTHSSPARDKPHISVLVKKASQNECQAFIEKLESVFILTMNYFTHFSILLKAVLSNTFCR